MPNEPSLSFIAGDIAARYGSEFELDRRELANAIETALKAERERCVKDVCGYCDGRFPQYDPIPAGPNAANNWIHLPKENGDSRLCAATGIFSRTRYAAAIRGSKQ